MLWVRAAGSALALLLLMTTAAAGADSPEPQVEFEARATPAPVISETAASRKDAVSSVVSVVRRLESLTGGHRVSVGVSPGSQVIGVLNGRIISDHWVNFHISVGWRLP